jgi:hypothetical protein
MGNEMCRPSGAHFFMQSTQPYGFFRFAGSPRTGLGCLAPMALEHSTDRASISE